MRLLLVIFCLFLVFSNANSQNNKGSVSGTVSELLSGESVISISVVLYFDSVSTSVAPFRGSITNKFGFYSIQNIPDGVYKLVAKGISYKPYIAIIEIKNGLTVRKDIKIERKDIMLDEIVVFGDKEDNSLTRMSSVTLDPSFVSKMPSLGGETDIFRTLQLLPGIKQVNELSSGLYVRGGSPDQNLYLLDGVIVYNPSHLGGFLSVFNSDAIKDIKIMKGAFPAEYGGRLSSVLDMTMKEGTKEKMSVAGGISLISSRLTIEGPIDEKSSFMISGRRMYLDLITKLAAGEDRDDVPVYYFYDLNMKVNYELSPSDKLFVSGFLCEDVLKEPPSADGNFDIFWGNKTANLRWMHIVSDNLFTNFSLIYTNYRFGTDIYDKDRPADMFKSKSHIEDIMLRGEAQYFPDDEHKLKFGVETIWHNFLSDLNIGIDINDEVQNLFKEKNITTLEAAVYVQDEWTVNDVLNLNIGGRGFYFQEGNYFQIEPRLSGSYKIDNNTHINSSVALAHQFLHLIVRNDIALPTDLWFPTTEKVKPSKSWQGVLGVEHLLDDGKYLFSAELYYKDMQNLLEYKDSTNFSLGIPFEEQFTSGRGEAYGLELFLNKRAGNFTGWIGYTLSFTKRYFDELNNGKMFFPRYDRTHDVNIVLTYKIGENWELGAAWYYGTGQAYTMPTGTYRFEPIDGGGYYDEKYHYSDKNGVRLPAFHKLDLNFMYKFRWFDAPFQLSINIYNVYNRKNPFAWYIDNEYSPDGMSSKKVLKQITLFPFIPTIGLSFKF